MVSVATFLVVVLELCGKFSNISCGNVGAAW